MMRFFIIGLWLMGSATALVAKSVEDISFPPFTPDVISTETASGVADSLMVVRNLLDKEKYDDALAIALKVLDKSKKNKNYSIALESSTIIADIFQKSNNYDRALSYYKQALEFYNKTGISHAHTLAYLYNEISKSNYLIGEKEEAVYYSRKIIEIESETLEVKNIKGKAYNKLAAYHIDNNNLNLAEQYALNSMKISRNKQDSLSIAYSLNMLATVYMQQEKYDLAKKYFQDVLTIIESITSAPEVLEMKEVVYDNLSWVLFKTKNHNAYVYQEKSINIRDSLRDVEISKIFAEIEGKYNAESIKRQEQLKTAEEKAKRKHTQDINIILMLILGSLLIGSWLFFRYFKLRQENLKLEMNRKELQRQNELDKLENESREKILNATIDGKESERKMIAETLHHSVSSLLSSANLHLQASKMQMKDLTPEEIFKAQKIINEAAEKIRNLSHSLVSSVLLKFGLKYAIQDMCEKYSNSALSFTCECSDIPRFAPSFELKINSIVDELLNNIIKHSHATESNIAIDSYNNRLNISIIDNGTGFKINQNTKSNGLGLTQIEARIKKMDGVFKIDSSPKTGTKVFISVPVVHKDEEKEVTNFFKN